LVHFNFGGYGNFGSFGNARVESMNCQEIEPSLAPYVDGECPAPERSGVEAHLAACPFCRAKVATERASHELLRARCRDLRGCAPAALRQRCAAQRAAGHRGILRRQPWLSLSLAATLVLAIGVFLLFGLGSSVDTYAAQLAVDHLKCFQFPPAAASGDIAAIGREWQVAHGWPLRVAAPSASEHLELLGIRRCGSSHGSVAHVLYRWRGRPLSLYVLNARVEHVAAGEHDPIAHDAVKKLGQQEIVWSDKGRTYAVVARAPLADVQQVALYVRRRIE
jgi:anti-sigma factor RsiW